MAEVAAFDVAIAGAGPAGAACALFLVERGFDPSRIALFDARTREAADADERLIAISQGSATLLARLGAWRGGKDRGVDRGVEGSATAIHAVHVSQRGRFGRTLIERTDHGVDALGWVVRHGDLTAALDDALARAGVVVARPLAVTAVRGSDGAIVVETADGATATARHVVHAEGGLFDAQRRRAIHRDYAQSAVTAFVTVGPGFDGATAYERFTAHGPIALLPATDPRPALRSRRGYALVWCGRPDEAAARAALDTRAFLDALFDAFGDRLGRFEDAGPRRVFPLGLNAVDVPARALGARGVEFAIGNAAQTLHPVAGQGLNLGLRDAHALAALLAGSSARSDDARALARRYVAARRVDRAATVDVTDLMARVFATPLAPVSAARGLALALLDVAPPLRSVVARQMMDGRR